MEAPHVKRRLTCILAADAVSYSRLASEDEEGTLRVLAELKTMPEEALFVGDSRADVLAARAAGLRVAIIRGGECDESAFAELPPDRFVSRLDEIAALAG